MVAIDIGSNITKSTLADDVISLLKKSKFAQNLSNFLHMVAIDIGSNFKKGALVDDVISLFKKSKLVKIPRIFHTW